MKKIFSILLSVAMLAAFAAGCGEKAEKTEGGSSADAATIRIGGIGPTTGGAAIYGQAVENAAELAVAEINALGGINGAQISFKFQDDEHTPEKAVNAYNALKDWGMQILMGTVTSKPCIEVVAKTEADNMFMLTPSGSAVDCISGDNAFRVCFSDPNQGKASAEYIGTNDIASKVAVIYDSSDPYSQGIYETFAAEAETQKIEIVAAEAFTADNKTDFSVQVQKAKDAGAELVFLPIYYQEASLILSQAKAIDFAPMFFGCDGLDGILGVENFDTALAEGVMLLTPFAADAEDAATQKFVAAYKEKYGEIPNQFAADAYDAIYAIKMAGEKAGITADMSVSEMCDALKAAMLEIELPGLTGTIVWDESGEPSKDPKAVKIVNGAYTAM